MKALVLFFISLLFSTSAIADISCEVEAGWSLKFETGSNGSFFEVNQILKDGRMSEADTILRQAYLSVSEFKARVEFDGQDVNIRTNLDRFKDGNPVYAGILTKNGVSQVVTCQ